MMKNHSLHEHGNFMQLKSYVMIPIIFSLFGDLTDLHPFKMISFNTFFLETHKLVLWQTVKTHIIMQHYAVFLISQRNVLWGIILGSQNQH